MASSQKSTGPRTDDETPVTVPPPTPTPDPSPVVGQPLPEPQSELEELKRTIAAQQELIKSLTQTPLEAAKEEDPNAVGYLIHFVEDGFTAFETIWYKGQELEVVKGTPEWNATLDKDGKSWLEQDETTQFRRYKQVYFRQGPWPGEEWDAEAKAMESSRRRRILTPSVK